jgi:hypothetical protein
MNTLAMRAPLFIIGYPRSGTSFTGRLLGLFTGYPDHGESHVSTLLQELHYQIDLCRKRNRCELKGDELIASLDLQSLKQVNSDFFREFYLSQYGSEAFIDKTPGAVACHGWRVVKSIFPNASFIACTRSPVEVITSFRAKFGSSQGNEIELDPIHIARGWASAMEGLQELASSEYSNDLMVVSQLQLRAAPMDILIPLFDFIGISRDRLAEAMKICATSREDVLTDAINLNEYKKLCTLGLPLDQEQLFREICSEHCARWAINI